MKSRKILLLLVLTISNQLFAQNQEYELVSFSNNVRRSSEEILLETNKTRGELYDYNCSENYRNDLFTARIFENKEKSSLKVSDQKGNLFTYRDSSLIDSNGNIVSRIRDNFLKATLRTLIRLEKVPEAKQLIEELQVSQFNFVIVFGGNRYDPTPIDGTRRYLHGNEAGFISMLDDLRPLVETFAFKNIGFGGRIYWNPKVKADFIEVDNIKREVDPDVVLVHEMYHAYDGMRGLLDRRYIKSDNLEFQPVCEFRAVRMENITRRGLGSKFRRFYSEPNDLSSSKDMLDENDEPEVIPAPCINWL